MNFRITLILAVIAVLLGGYLVLGPRATADPDQTIPTNLDWFYEVDDSAIHRLDAAHFGQEQTYIRDETRTWHAGDVTGPEVTGEFAGTPFLAGGARTPRLIAAEPAPNLVTTYGLDDPKTSLRFYLEDGRDYRVQIGGLTPDRINNYARIEGFPAIYLLDRTWGEHMARLVTEQSVFIQAPTPEPDPTAPADLG